MYETFSNIYSDFIRTNPSSILYFYYVALQTCIGLSISLP